MRIGTRLPKWAMILAIVSFVSLGIVFYALSKPLPEYLVAAKNLKPGEVISVDSLEKMPADLGSASGNYLTEDALLPGSTVSRVVRQGEFLARADLSFEFDVNKTAMRITPKLKPSELVQPGTDVAIWQVAQDDEGLQVQRLVARAEVLDLIYGEGLFAKDLPEVELRITIDQMLLLIQAISSESDVYLVPLS